MTIVISSAMLLAICVVVVAVALPELFLWLLGIAACAALVFFMYCFGVPVWISVPVVLAMLVLAGFIDLPSQQRKAKAFEPPDDDATFDEIERFMAERKFGEGPR